MKIVFILLLIFSFFTFQACKEEKMTFEKDYVFIGISFDEDGVTQSINFGVNSEKIKKISENNSDYFTFLGNLNIRREYLFTFALKYMENPDENFMISKGVKLSNVIYSSQTDSVGFSINFPSIESWNYYHRTNSSSSESIKKKSIFIDRTASKTQLIFCNKKDDVMLGETYRQIYLSSAQGIQFKEELTYFPDFVYSYCSQYEHLHSNSMYKFSKGENNYHVWKVKCQDLNDGCEVELWLNQINYGAWYITVLLGVLVPCSLILTVKVLRAKYKGKKRLRK